MRKKTLISFSQFVEPVLRVNTDLQLNEWQIYIFLLSLCPACFSEAQTLQQKCRRLFQKLLSYSQESLMESFYLRFCETDE